MVKESSEGRAPRAIDSSRTCERAANPGAVERFVEEFNRLELEEALFDRCVDPSGFAWWDNARYSVQKNLCIRLGIIGNGAATPRPPISRFLSGAGQVSRMILDLRKLVFLRRHLISGLFVFGRDVRPLITDLNARTGRCIVVSKDGHGRSGDLRISKRSVDLFIRFASNFVRVPAAVDRLARHLDSRIEAKFKLTTDSRTIIVRKYREHVASRILWSRVFKATWADAAFVGYVNDDSLKTLVSLAGTASLRTREYQHGYMGRSHIAFSYPPLTRRLTTIPDEVVVDFDSGDIEYPARIVRVTSAPHRDVPGGERDIDVLVGGSPTRNADAMAIVQALVGRGLAIAVKLHPAQTEESTGLRARYNPGQVAVFAGDEDFRALAERSKIYVPANPTSTTCYEAFDSGARVLVIDYGATKLTTAMDRFVHERVTAIDLLADAIERAVGSSHETASIDGSTR